MNEQIEQMISQLDAKIESLNATRTDPDAIANMISNNLRGFVSTIVSNFLRSKREEELELAKPRDVIKQPLAIDIVSVSPTAAGQIAAALEAAGIGKYNLKINHVASEGADQSDSMISKIMKVAGVALAIALGAVLAFGTPLLGWITSFVQSIMEFFDGDQDTPNFDKKMQDLENKRKLAVTNPEQLFTDANAIDITSSVTASNTSGFIATMEKYNDSESPPEKDPMDNFMQNTLDGRIYSQQMIDSSGQRDLANTVYDSIDQLQQDYRMLYNTDDAEVIRSYINQATTEQGVTLQFLEKNQEHLQLPAEKAFEQLQKSHNTTSDTTAVHYSTDQNTRDMISGASLTSMDDINYFETQQGLDQLIPDDHYLQEQLDKLSEKAQPVTEQTETADKSMPPAEKSKTTSPDLQSDTITSPVTSDPTSSLLPPTPTESEIPLEKVSPTPPEPPAPPPSPESVPSETTDLSYIQNLIEQELQASENSLAMLQSINQGLQQPTGESTMVTSSEMTQDDFSAEHVRKQWRTSPLGSAVTTRSLA